jgi:hypothetical protein
MDILVPELDSIIVRLQAHGFHPYMLIDELAEAPYMQRTFPQSAYWDLDWAPRATFSGAARIWLLDPADREPHREGRRYPSDVLR